MPPPSAKRQFGPAENIEHPTSNIEHRTSNIQHRTSNIQHLGMPSPEPPPLTIGSWKLELDVGCFCRENLSPAVLVDRTPVKNAVWRFFGLGIGAYLEL